MKNIRWPECHTPGWATWERSLDSSIDAYIRAVVSRYKDEKIIEMWQIENEPFLNFGECPKRPDGYLDQEIALVMSLDPGTPVLVTDSGEIGEWIRAAKLGNVFGTSIYRKIYPEIWGPLVGPVEYPIPAEFFRLKEKFVRWYDDLPNKRFIVHELQAEPWLHQSLNEAPVDDQIDVFSPAYFKKTIVYAKAAGFDEYYVWGAEWWYWMKMTHNDSRYWDIAKQLFEPRE